MDIKEFLVNNQVVSGFAEARRIIYMGLVSIDGKTIYNPNYYLDKHIIVRINEGNKNYERIYVL